MVPTGSGALKLDCAVIAVKRLQSRARRFVLSAEIVCGTGKPNTEKRICWK